MSGSQNNGKVAAASRRSLAGKQSPDGSAALETGQELLDRILAERRKNWTGRGTYQEPAAPKTDNLPALPEGWTWASPDQVSSAEAYSLAIGPFGSNLKVSDYTNAGVPLVFVRNIRSSRFGGDRTVYVSASKALELRAHQIRAGDLLVTKMGEPPGDACLYPDSEPDAVITADCIKLRLAPLLSQKRFFVHAINSGVVKSQIQLITKGVAQMKVSLGRFSTLAIPLPPLPIQHRIVAEIEKQFTRLDAGVAALRRVQANLKRYRAAVLKAACEGKLVPTEAALQETEGRRQKGFETGAQLLQRILAERRKNWTGRGPYKEPAAPDTANLPELPDGWVWVTIDALAFVTKLAGFEYTKFVKYDPEGDSAVIKAENAGLYGFKRTEFSKVKSSTVAHLTRSRVIAGDLLMVFVGSVGNVARVPDDQDYFLGPNIAMIRIQATAANPAYIEKFLQSPFGRELTFGFVKAVTQPSLSMGTIRMIPVALPPLIEQTRIVAEVERRLSVVEELEAVVTANLQRAKRLRQSILQKAFTGQLSPVG